jgi:hypothetical protein
LKELVQPSQRFFLFLCLSGQLLPEALPEVRIHKSTESTPLWAVRIINTISLKIHKHVQGEITGRISGGLVDQVQIIRALSGG